MKTVSMILFCSAVILAGLSSVSENRKKTAAKKTLAELFGFLAEKISDYGCGFIQALSMAVQTGVAGNFLFPQSTVSEFSAGQDLEELWKSAVEKDGLLKKIGTESTAAVKELCLHFADTTPQSVALACRRLSERFSADAAEARQKAARDERLSLAVSLLGAAVVCIVML